MNRLEKAGVSLLAVLWLTSSTPQDLEFRDVDADLGQDDAPVLLVPSSPQGAMDGLFVLPLEQGGDPNTLLGLGMRSREAATVSGACDDNLSHELVTREIYRRLSQGDTFRSSGEHADDAGEDHSTISQRLQSFRREREERYEHLFACQGDDKEIHERASYLVDHPNDREAFMNLYVDLVEQRGEEVLALYDLKDFEDFADLLMEQSMRQLRARFSDFDEFVDEKILREAVHQSIAENHDELALMALKGELVDIFQAQSSVPRTFRLEMPLALQKIIARDLVEHMAERVQRRTFDRTSGRKFEI
ncbi:MAG: hypothetical protein KDI61_02990 [Alphaproteobacteria bacterium]|nr:hypothetical protein [Alphaproteobacteria bacterium]MCB1839217.1 hypothetical protein [Alphaproteobacteria bacterium]